MIACNLWILALKFLLDNDFKYLTEKFGYKNLELVLELLTQKDAYLYEYMDSFKRSSEEKLPDKECFYSSVKDGTTGDKGKILDGHINDKGYLTCKKKLEWIKHEKYGKGCSVINWCFWKVYWHIFKILWPWSLSFFFSFWLSWDAMLKMSGVRLKRIVDIDMYLFIEKRLRRGISYIAKRCCKANKWYMQN